MKKTTFKISNWNKPTPYKVSKILGLTQEILAGISAISIISDYKALAIGLSIAIVVTGRLGKFFGEEFKEGTPDK